MPAVSGMEVAAVYCGHDMVVPTTHFSPRASSPARPQNTALFQLTPSDVHATPEWLRRNILRMWNDARAEHDAEFLCRELEALRHGSRIELSSEFLAFERAWRQDEWIHYQGLSHLLSLVAETPVEEIHQRVEGRTPNFGPIRHFMKDEFSLLVLLAFDEAATVLSYGEDRPMYDALGLVCEQWLDVVIVDEANHLWNAMEVLRRNHRHRFAMVPGIVDSLVAWYLADHPYTGTFALDPSAGNFTPQLLKRCADTINRRLN